VYLEAQRCYTVEWFSFLLSKKRNFDYGPSIGTHERKGNNLLQNWHKVSFREVSQFLGQINSINSMHPVLQGVATLRSKFLQTFINIRHFHNLSWEKPNESDFNELFGKGKNELVFWKENILHLNFRAFDDPDPSCIGWVDASYHAVGEILIKIIHGASRPMPVTMDYWVLDGAGVLPIIRNCARLQIDDIPTRPRIVTDHDLDPDLVEKIYFVHRNLTYAEQAMDSNERELLAAVELLLGCVNFLQNNVFTLHFDNMNEAMILGKGSSKFRLQNYALYFDELCRRFKIRLKTV
jgi:hypothetical protein